MPEATSYASFLVRIWREAHADHADEAIEWRAEVEHIQTGQISSFTDFDALSRHLRAQTENPQEPNQAGHSPPAPEP